MCDCLHLTTFNLFMDWTGECFGLPSTPTTDLLSKVDSILTFFLSNSSMWMLYHFFIPQVCLALSVICLMITEGMNHCNRKIPYGRRMTLHEISKGQRRSVQRLRNAWLVLAQLCWLLLTEIPVEITSSNIACQLCGALTHLAWMLFWFTSGKET